MKLKSLVFGVQNGVKLGQLLISTYILKTKKFKSKL